MWIVDTDDIIIIIAFIFSRSKEIFKFNVKHYFEALTFFPTNSIFYDKLSSTLCFTKIVPINYIL